MTLPTLWLRLEAPHLEPLEPVLDVLEGADVAILLGPALQLTVGPGLVPALASSEFSCWLDLALPTDLADIDVWAKLLARSQAKGAVINGDAFELEDARPALAAVVKLSDALGTRPLLLRLPRRLAAAPPTDGLLAHALQSAGVAAVVTPAEDGRGAGSGTWRDLKQVHEGKALAPAAFAGGRDSISAPPERYIDRHLVRHADPLRYLAQLQGALRPAEA